MENDTGFHVSRELPENGGIYPWTGKLFDNGAPLHLFPESRRTARDILLRNAQTRGSLCSPQWGTTCTPLLCISLHGRTGTFISSVQEATNAVPDCFQNRYKRPVSLKIFLIPSFENFSRKLLDVNYRLNSVPWEEREMHRIVEDNCGKSHKSRSTKLFKDRKNRVTRGPNDEIVV